MREEIVRGSPVSHRLNHWACPDDSSLVFAFCPFLTESPCAPVLPHRHQGKKQPSILILGFTLFLAPVLFSWTANLWIASNDTDSNTEAPKGTWPEFTFLMSDSFPAVPTSRVQPKSLSSGGILPGIQQGLRLYHLLLLLKFTASGIQKGPLWPASLTSCTAQTIELPPVIPASGLMLVVELEHSLLDRRLI